MDPDPLLSARVALERGEYGAVVRLLEPLADLHAASSPLGSSLRLLMATALMGTGESGRAADLCRALQTSADPLLRSQARDLLMVLEAPRLRRPREWSLTLPELRDSDSVDGSTLAPLRRRQPRQMEVLPPPQVGPTRSPLGFGALVLLVMVLLAFLLGGCMDMSTDLEFGGPGRLRISHHLGGPSGRQSPFQKRFAAQLEGGALPFKGLREGGGRLLQTPMLPAAEALSALSGSIDTAAAMAGIQLPPQNLQLKERNWLLGVNQHLLLEVDLRRLESLRGIEVVLRLSPIQARAVVRASPLAVGAPRNGPFKKGNGVTESRNVLCWPVQVGAMNVLELHRWRWSPLGLGSLAIACALGLALILQRIRRQLGFGLPELPA